MSVHVLFSFEKKSRLELKLWYVSILGRSFYFRVILLLLLKLESGLL